MLFRSNQELFAEYARLRAERDALDEKVSAIGIQVVAYLQESNVEKLETPNGTFSVIKVPRWSYSENIEKQEEGIKKEKERERAEGIAQSQYTTSLRFQK